MNNALYLLCRVTYLLQLPVTAVYDVVAGAATLGSQRSRHGDDVFLRVRLLPPRSAPLTVGSAPVPVHLQLSAGTPTHGAVAVDVGAGGSLGPRGSRSDLLGGRVSVPSWCLGARRFPVGPRGGLSGRVPVQGGVADGRGRWTRGYVTRVVSTASPRIPLVLTATWRRVADAHTNTLLGTHPPRPPRHGPVVPGVRVGVNLRWDLHPRMDQHLLVVAEGPVNLPAVVRPRAVPPGTVGALVVRLLRAAERQPRVKHRLLLGWIVIVPSHPRLCRTGYGL